jgi:hypothetical protein
MMADDSFGSNEMMQASMLALINRERNATLADFGGRSFCPSCICTCTHFSFQSRSSNRPDHHQCHSRRNWFRSRPNRLDSFASRFHPLLRHHRFARYVISHLPSAVSGLLTEQVCLHFSRGTVLLNRHSSVPSVLNTVSGTLSST